jgi:hypothetical protein
MKYIKLVTEAVEKDVASQLPSKFGIIIDGWKEIISLCSLAMMESLLFWQ